MGSEWCEFSLSEVSDKIGDGLHGTPTYSERGDYYFINGNNLENGEITIKESTKRVDYEQYEKHKKELTRNSVLVSINGTIGNVALYNGEEVVLGKSACYINLKDDVHRDFVSYVLSSHKFQEYIQRCATGSTIKNVSLKMMREFTFNMPSDEKDQVKAVASLKNLDRKIRINQQTNQTLEQVAQALFKSWFVDFDPVIDNALAAGSEIPEALQYRVEIRKKAHALQKQNPNIQPLPASTQRLFPSEFEHCGDNTLGIQGWIPRDWRVSITGTELGIKGGSTPSTINPDFWDGGDIHWTSPKDLSGNDSKILLHTSRKITEAGLAKITSGLLPIDTVLMSSRAPVGYLALTKVPLAINQGYIALECEKDLTPEFTIQFLNSIMDEIKGISGGTTFAEISKKTFRSIKLIVPSKPAIEAYTSIVKANYDKITQNIRQTNTLTDTRDYLLPKLISGELQLKE